MPLSKARQQKWMKDYRQRREAVIPSVIPKPLPDYLLQTNCYLLAHIKAYPAGFNPDGIYRADFNPKLDPFINPMARDVIPNLPLPNSPDGRYH